MKKKPRLHDGTAGAYRFLYYAIEFTALLKRETFLDALFLW